MERLAERARPGLPQLDRLVVRCRGQRRAVRREGYRVDAVPMAFERLAERSCSGVPQLDRLVA